MQQKTFIAGDEGLAVMTGSGSCERTDEPDLPASAGTLLPFGAFTTIYALGELIVTKNF
ncbi:MAG: hypothetical protein KF824_07985 [Fimbriimonadaceae bacterium]|nr:MAG: hypothetical protein KF824_07985 [Fimbriimonadaceae bacterium]